MKLNLKNRRDDDAFPEYAPKGSLNIGSTKDREYYRRYKLLRKTRVMTHYSGGKEPFCRCCGENNIFVLHLDHIKTDSQDIRKYSNNNVYGYLIRNNFPIGYQVLCFLCNTSKGNREKCKYHATVENSSVDV